MNSELLDRIAKLLALAEKNNNVHEAATAAAMAQSLLSKHRLTMADVEASREEQIAEHDPLYQSNRLTSWKGVLAQGVSEANGVEVFWAQTCMRIVGRLSDVQIVRYFYVYLEREIERLARMAQIENIDQSTPPIKGRAEVLSFKLGAAGEISRRLRDSVKQVHQECTDSTALMRLDQKDRELRYYLKQKYALRQRSCSAPSDRSAYEKGREAGATVALNRGLDGKPVRMLR